VRSIVQPMPEPSWPLPDCTCPSLKDCRRRLLWSGPKKSFVLLGGFFHFVRFGIRTAEGIRFRLWRSVNPHCAAHAPEEDRHGKPGDRCKSKGAGGSVSREQPHDCTEYGECDAAEARASCVKRCGVLSALFALQPLLFLSAPARVSR
jgi:hypothetical protein